MPDFDKNLKPILKNEESHLPDLDNPASTGRFGYQQSVQGRQSAVDSFFGNGPVINEMAPTVTSKELFENRRYDVFSPDITDIENQKANAQSWGTQAANGILKGLNLTATTVVGGFGMLEGALESAFSGRLADIWDNQIMRDLDDWNTKVDQEYLPNYYSTKETEANWYSTDNWFRPNFLFDKLVKNSGYAVGAMISGNIANAGILRAGRAIGALADTYAVANESSQAFKSFTPLLRNTARAFSAGKNIEAAQILEKGIASVADITAQSSELAEIAKQTNLFAKINDIGRRTAIAAYSSAGEASFEALQTSKEYRKNAIEEFTRVHGYEPTGQDLDKINQEAEAVGKTSFFGNMAILSATEYVQLPKLLGSSYSASKQAANSLMGQVDNVVLREGKYVAEEAASKFGKLYDKVTGVGRYVFDPKEGLQEGLQYALQVGTQNYYNKAYQTGNADMWVDGFLYGVNGTKDGKGVGVLNTKEGMESILLGGITGGLMQVRGNLSERAAINSNTQAFLNTLNTTPSFKQAFQDRMDAINRGVVLQEQQQAAVVQGDRLEAKDLDADLLHNYLAPRIKYGRYDMITEDIKELKRDGLTEGGLSQLKEQGLANINDTVETYQQRLANFERVAGQVDELYKSLDLRYSGQVDVQGNRIYTSQVIDKMVYAGAKIMNYDARIPQVSAPLIDAGIDTTAVLTDIIKNKKPNKEATEAAIEQINNMDVTSELKDDLKLALTDTIELSLRRKLFMDQYDDIKENPEKYQVKVQLEEEPEGTVEVKQKEGRKTKTKELAVGQEYSLEDPIYKKGSQLIAAPKLTVLAKTLGGEFEVKLPDGTVSFFTPEQFKQFKITEQQVSDVEVGYIMNKAVENVLKKAEFSGIEKAEDQSDLDFVNSLNNPELTDAIYEEYNKVAKNYLKKKAKADKIKKGNEEILNSQKSESTVEQTGANAAEYEQVNRKTKLVLPRATVSTPQLPGYQNSIKFGADMYKFSNRKQIRGVYVTSKNEEQLGLKGLMNHIKGTSDVDPSKTIAQVMVEQVGNKIRVVGVDGKPLENPTFDTAVFQVMPDPKFQWSEKFGGKSMFPEGTTEAEKNAIIKEYTEFVNETLSSSDLVTFNTEASFGVPQYVKDAQGNDIKNARTGVVAAGLIQESDLTTKPVIYVPTLEDKAQRGSTSYSNAKGKIFLVAGNGYVPLQNKLHSEKEANVIYQAILKLANIKFEEGDFNSSEAKRLFDWLRSVTYWGTPKSGTASVNSVWFDKDGLLGLKLNMSNDGTTYPFNPLSIEANKDAIIQKLQGMYNNVRSSYVAKDLSNWNKPYEEIQGIDNAGKIKAKKWKNYQTYLLSTAGRTGEETPLTVPYQPATEASSNREGIYFVNTDTKDKYAGVVEKTTVAKKPILTPIAPSPTAGFEMDGKTPNTLPNAEYGDIVFTVDGEELTKSGGKTGVALVADIEGKLISQPAIDKLAKAKNFSVEKATQLLVNSIYQKLTTAPAQKAAAPAPAVAPVVEEVEETEELSPSAEELIKKQMGEMGDDTPFRLKVEQDTNKFEKEDWPKIEEFIKKNFPMLPVYRVKNVIRGLGGIEAWGMLKNGGIYVYENAEVGTAYHEVFEAVWKMFATAEERTNITNEFRNRTGSFVDRVTGETIKYKDATDFQLKEQLAEEFRDFVQYGKVPAKPAKGQPFIVKLFNDIVNFIKSFFVGPQAARNTEELFKRMTTGFYSEQFPARQGLSYARMGVIDVTDAFADRNSEMRIKDFAGQEVNDIMQQMTYEVLTRVMKPGGNIFNITSETITSDELKDALQKTALKSRKAAETLVEKGTLTAEAAAPVIAKSNALWQKITNNWDALLERHKEYLLSYNIEFDDNDQANLLADKGKDETYGGAENIDNFRKANSAIKLLLSTLPIVRDGELVYTSINGAKLIPTSEVYMAIINRTYSATTPDEMLANLRQLAIDDENYRTLYSRITGQKFDADGDVSYDNLDQDHQLRLVNALWTLFNKQNPTVKNLYILDNGDVQVGDSNFTTAARQLADEFKNGVVSSVKKESEYFEYSGLRKGYAPKVDRNGKAIIGKFPTDTIEDQVKFLAKIGIPFNINEVKQLDDDTKTRFSEATLGIKKSFNDLKVVSTLTGRTLSINGRLLDLATIQAKIENPEFDSVFYNVNGDATQTFIGVNAVSKLHNYLSKISNINELANTPYSYLLTDSFAQNSVILNRMFDMAGNGDRITGTENLMESSWADGTIDTTNGKKKQSSRLTYQERLIQELNMNIAGFYYNLVPGDASLEHMVNMGNTISNANVAEGFEEGGINEIFKGYFISELKLARERRDVRSNNELRFFKAILGEKLHDAIVAEEGEVFTEEEIYDDNKEVIDAAVAKYINTKTNQFKNSLQEYEIVTPNEEEGVWDLKNLSIGETISDEGLMEHLKMLQINFMINNIELHKLLYSDPYQYKDELKRIKNFLSPRQSLASNSSELNAALNNVYNKGFKEGEIGYVDFTKDYFNTITLSDVIAIGDLPGYEEGWEETDGGGVITAGAYRNYRIRSGNWNDAEEAQYRFDVKYEKAVKNGATKEQLAKLLESNPGIQSAYTPIKPIVSGNKGNGQLFNDIVLDKFSLYPLSFRVLHQLNADANIVKLYNKMQEENVDYGVFKSGRKVGAQETFDLYDENNDFNTAPFTEGQRVNVPFSIIANQSDVPSKEDGLVTRGSQITKLVTMDLMEGGVPVDYKEGYDAWIKLSDDEKKEASPLYVELKRNQLILEGMISLGFNNLLNSMGIKQVGEEFEVTNFSKAANTLRREILKREVNDNIADALAGFLEGKVTLEATPAYQQIRNILYSIADREVISQKVGGGMKVQIPSTLFEENRIKKEGEKGYKSDVLKFYTNKEGQRVAEVMLARWFDSTKTDQELLDYLNNTDEGQEILKGIGFRIPTQKQNSIDVIKVAKFLPKEFGDSVVVPSALVKKAGSDFDIDKLSVYLKNIYQDKNGDLKPIPYFGVGEKAINKLKALDLDINVYDVYKRSLENGYFTSLENLISSEENFNALTTPNSADQLKGLSTEIVKANGLSVVDYSDPGNMLDRRFMSRLRQAFISGKYAIGIAAVNQTNHSLNQRANIFVDFDGMKNKLNNEDKEWLGNGKIAFKEYNTVEVNGKTYPSLSKVLNTAGQRISDILSQFIDGYVDIAKGPWIIELGATPNTASTWMFLTKLGVPIKTTAYFMNQPIIRDYLRKIENSGYSWLFIDDFVKEIKEDPKYAVAENYNFSKFTTIPSNNVLLKNLGAKKFASQDDRAQQQFMLDEFLKYAKMASQMFNVTQGSNFDTATFNDPYLVFKKEQQLIKAQNTIIAGLDENSKIIPGVNAILENSFLGVMANRLQDVRNAYSKILKSDNKQVRDVVERVLLPYVDLPDGEFIKVAQKAVADLFDWAVQVDRKLNREVTNILLSENNAADQINDFVTKVRKNKRHKLYDNQAVKLLEHLPSPEKGGVNNVKIKNKTNKVYDQNEIINGFRELKEYLGDDPLYGKIVRLAVLQSGLSKSPIAFTSLLPYEDFEAVYNKTLSTLDKMSNLNDFYTLGVFQRNNWNNDNIVPYRKAKFKQNADGDWFYSNALNMKDQTIEEATNIGRIPQLMKLSSLARDANKDYIVYSWEMGNKQEKAEMRKRGDYSYIKKALFKKVYNGDKPLTTKNFYGTDNYVYKQINAWGGGIKANELYSVAKKSVIPNGFEVANEVQDEDILEYFTYDEATDAAKETVTAPNVVNEDTDLIEGKIALPRRDTKKVKFIVPIESKSGVTNLEKEGYRVIVPEYPNADVYVSNNAINADGQVFKTNTWAVEGGGSLASGRFKTIDEALADFQKKVNSITNPEVLKRVQEATKLFVGDPQETVTLQDGKAYSKLEINSKLLKKLGYTPEEIGNILKEIC